MKIFSKIAPLSRGSKAGIVCCSNGQPGSSQADLENLKNTLLSIGIIPVFSDFIYERDGVFSGTARERANALMDFYRDDEIKVIFDISGGDIANEVLPYLDYELIAQKEKMFWGYSDLTTVINAIYVQTAQTGGQATGMSVLYQIRNLIYDHADIQRENFRHTVMKGHEELLSFDVEFVQGEVLEGVVVGGNIRCLLKLAGTKYWPDMNHKILLLEAYGGTVPQMTTYLSQLAQIGVFEQIQGVLLGTFTKMEEQQRAYAANFSYVRGNEIPAMPELVRQYVRPELPIARTREIGHGTDAKAVIIGGRYRIERTHYE